MHQFAALSEAMFHSNQDSVYTIQAYQINISRKGTPVENAPIESFYPTIKSEMFYLEGLTHTTTIDEETVPDYIAYYTTRIQTKLNNQSPFV